MRRLVPILAVAVLALAGSGGAAQQEPSTMQPKDGQAVATFAGGCFWCMEPPFDKLAGVVSTTSGYTGGRTENPTYEQVSTGRTGHTEAVEVVYDPRTVTYAQLLEVFWRNIDPYDASGQFCDKGQQYTAAIFYGSPEEKRAADLSKEMLERSGRVEGRIVTQILPAAPFYPAEDYHQHYYKKNPVKYKFYRWNCGRDKRLQQVWGR